ncbi:hypothetical protein FS842_005011 [Serendipita sp. 407]|nr:hypothetical protein FS842_005011 [Serendipita sp. 407]
MIIEDIGPVYTVSLSSLAVLIRCVPILLITIASAWFVVSTMINVWRARHIEPPKGVNEPGHLRFDRTLPRKKVTKYMALSIWTLISVVFGCIWAFMPALLSPSPWYAKPDIRGNIRQLPLIHTASRYEVDPNVAGSRKLFFISIPVMGIVIFVFFGLGLEALKTYHSWLRTLFLLLKLPTLFNFLRIHTLRLGSWNQRVIPVNPEYFAPFESEDINLDPHSPADLPKASRRSSARTFPDIPLKIQPSSHPAPLRGSRLSKNPLGSPLEEWRMHHKQPSITEPNPIPQSPAFSPFKLRWNDKQGFMVSNRWISYHKKPISPRYGPQTSTFPSPDRPHFSVDSSPTVPRSNSQRMPQLIIGSQWVSSIGQPTCYDGLPPPYRPPVDRGSTSDPLSDLF